MPKQVTVTPDNFDWNQECIVYEHGGFWGDESKGCFENLDAAILEAWDGKSTEPFIVTCPCCGYRWQFSVKVVLEIGDRRYVHED